MKPLHPALIDWLDDPKKRELMTRIIKAENALGQFGTITIKYIQGQAEKITVETTAREQV